MMKFLEAVPNPRSMRLKIARKFHFTDKNSIFTNLPYRCIIDVETVIPTHKEESFYEY